MECAVTMRRRECCRISDNDKPNVESRGALRAVYVDDPRESNVAQRHYDAGTQETGHGIRAFA